MSNHRGNPLSISLIENTISVSSPKSFSENEAIIMAVPFHIAGKRIVYPYNGFGTFYVHFFSGKVVSDVDVLEKPISII